MPWPSSVVGGQRVWGAQRDVEGHRTYKIMFRVRTDSPIYGPATVLQTPGLPTYGSVWLVDGDVDLWAWCRWDCDVKAVIDNEPNVEWDVTFTFSTKPPESHGTGSPSSGNGPGSACKTNQVEDPLLEPMKVSGGWKNIRKEAVNDRHGLGILNSGREQVRGPQVEFDSGHTTIKIEQNVALLELGLCLSMVDTLNDRPLWGLAARHIKLNSFSWDRKYKGVCEVYYTRIFEFEAENPTVVTGQEFDRTILDEGTKVLHGQWDKDTGNWKLLKIGLLFPRDANPLNPADFDRFTDKAGNPARTLYSKDPNKLGQPATGTDDINRLGPIEYYTESNFLLLGIPLDF